MKVLKKFPNDGSSAMKSIHRRAGDSSKPVHVPVLQVCPYLAINDDRETAASFARQDHVCLQASARFIDMRWQGNHCLSGRYAQCPVFNGQTRPIAGGAQGQRRYQLRDRLIVSGFTASILAVMLTLGMVFANLLEPDHLVADGSQDPQQSSVTGIDGGDTEAEQVDGQVRYASRDASYDPLRSPRTRHADQEQSGHSPGSIDGESPLSIGGTSPPDEAADSSESVEGGSDGSETSSGEPDSTESERPDPAPEPSGTGQSGTYIVQPGDTLWGIAERHGISVDELMHLNGIEDPNLLFPGEELVTSAG